MPNASPRRLLPAPWSNLLSASACALVQGEHTYIISLGVRGQPPVDQEVTRKQMEARCGPNAVAQALKRYWVSGMWDAPLRQDPHCRAHARSSWHALASVTALCLPPIDC